MHDSARPHGTLNRRRFLSLSSQSLLALSLSQLIPVNLLAEERQAELPDGLLRMGRDIFPHDFISDRHYVQPLLDLAEQEPALIGGGLDELQRQARKAHGKRFEQLDEAERVALLSDIENTPFFKAVRSSLMFGLYDNKALFPLFGYEGSSWEYGGYVNRGFNDLNWL